MDVIWAMALRRLVLAACMSMLPIIFPLLDVFRCFQVQKQIIKSLTSGITEKNHNEILRITAT